MPRVDLRITAGSAFNFVIPDTTRDADFVFNLTGASSPPSSVALDPDKWILDTVTPETYAVHIIYDTLKTGLQGYPYSDSVIVRGGSGPYTFQLISGSLPTGLNLNLSTGVITGNTSVVGPVSVQIKATGFTGGNETKTIKFNINAVSYIFGDANHDGMVNISDVVYLISYIFAGGPAPTPLQSGDANGDCFVNISDGVYLIAYIFSGGPAPIAGC
jgi:hypothetical protein